MDDRFNSPATMLMILSTPDGFSSLTFWFPLISFLLLIGISIFLFIDRKKLLDILSVQKNTINDARQQLLQLQKSLYENELKLAEISELLSKAEKKQSSSIGMIVHDLKSPLYNIMSLSAGQHANKQFEIIHETSKKMLRLVLNMLDLRKNEEVGLNLNLAAFDFVALVNEVVASLGVSLRNKSLSISVRGAQCWMVHADKELIGRLLENLLSNAINHTYEGKTVVVEVRHIEKQLHCTVSNWGNPIPKEMQEMIFEPFMQASLPDASVRTSGLGLAFCKMVAGLHGGKIGVESQSGEPTRFWFTLPADAGVSAENGETIFDFTQPIHMAEGLLQKAPFLKELVHLQVYDMSKVLAVLQSYQPQHDELGYVWKKDLENAVYHCDNERYHELVKWIE